MDRKFNSTIRGIVTLLCTMCIGMVIGHLTIQALLMPPTSQLASSQAAYKQFLLTSQAIMSCGIFIVGPLLYWYQFEHKPLRYLITGEQRYRTFIGFICILMLSAMVVNTVFIYLNMQLKFPSWLAGFERWAQDKEAALKQLTKIITTYHSFTDFLMTIVVIGIIPAIGEELVFRGILQNLFFRGTNNMHIAILMSACIFSAIHLQLYGFLPRFLLGALFGYLYAWTKNLAYPIIAHFLNNSLTLILLFIQQHTFHQFSEEQQLLPLLLLITCTLIGTLLIVHIYKQTRYLHHHPTSQLNSL